MSPEQILCLILIFAGLAALAWLWREAALDFAERQFADEAESHRSYGDWVALPDDLKIRNHAERNAS